MTEVIPTFGIEKGEYLNERIREWLDEKAWGEWGTQEDWEVRIVFGGVALKAIIEHYQLYFAYLNIDDTDELERLLRKHHKDYCFILTSGG